jgi:hypothetical protein
VYLFKHNSKGYSACQSSPSFFLYLSCAVFSLGMLVRHKGGG